MNNTYTKLYFLFVFFILGSTLSTKSYAQEQISLRERAERLYYEYQYANAVPLYLRLAEGKKPQVEDLERLADSYYKMNNYGEAANWYARSVEHEDSSPETWLSYAKVLKQNARYADAKNAFLEYAERSGNRTAVENDIAGSDSAIHWMANPTEHVLINEKGINTPRSEFSAYPVGDKVYYASESSVEDAQYYGWTGNPFLNLLVVDKNEGQLQNPVMAELFNAEHHIGPLSSNQAGDVLFVTRNYPVSRKSAMERNGNRNYYTYRLGLEIYKKNDRGEWSQESFQYNNVAEFSLGHATLSPDESTLYFVSDMPGGMGGTDIWYSEKQSDGSWGQPINAGSDINSAGNELFPNITEEGVLYFSSDGFPGMGGLDIFSSTGNKEQWAKPINLKYPINSPGDDFAFISTQLNERETTGFLSSDRTGGFGADDIYSFRYKAPRIILILKGNTYNADTKDALPQTMVSLLVNGKELIAKQDSKHDGSFLFEIEKDMDYTLIGDKHGYFGDSTTVSTMGINKSDTLYAALYLKPVFEVGKNLELENIHYDFDKHNIRKDAAEILDRLVKTLNEYPTLKIELSSHTDSRGSDSYNMALSQRRAQAAVDYLVAAGISRDRMVAQGYGESRLLNHCSNGVWCSIEDHQANRRTEVTVLEFK